VARPAWPRTGGDLRVAESTRSHRSVRFHRHRESQGTIAGEPPTHLLYHFRLCYSVFQCADVVLGGESLVALSGRCQNALWLLGGVRKTPHRQPCRVPATSSVPSNEPCCCTARATSSTSPPNAPCTGRSPRDAARRGFRAGVRPGHRALRLHRAQGVLLGASRCRHG